MTFEQAKEARDDLIDERIAQSEGDDYDGAFSRYFVLQKPKEKSKPIHW